MSMMPIQMFDRSKARKAGTPIAKSGNFKTPHTPVLSRMPQELIDLLDTAANASFRSRSAEMVYRLQASFENESIDEHGCIVVHAKPSSK